jgi:hypothetical protein
LIDTAYVLGLRPRLRPVSNTNAQKLIILKLIKSEKIKKIKKGKTRATILKYIEKDKNKYGFLILDLPSLFST